MSISKQLEPQGPGRDETPTILNYLFIHYYKFIIYLLFINYYLLGRYLKTHGS